MTARRTRGYDHYKNVAQISIFIHCQLPMIRMDGLHKDRLQRSDFVVRARERV